MAKLTITRNCPFCNTPQTKEFDEEHYRKYEAGAPIQDVMPNLSADDREFLITGICHKCWNSTFNGGSDDV